MNTYDIVIVGGGLAAAKTAQGYREAGGNDSVVILATEAHLPYSRPALSKKVMRGEAEPDSTTVHPQSWYAENDVEVRLETSAESLDTARKVVQTDGGEFGYERLVIATGSLPRTLEGAQELRTIDDAVAIRERAQRDGKITLVGTGFIGSEVCASLCALGVDVTLVTGGFPFFASFGSKDFSDYLERVYRNEEHVTLTEAPTDDGFVVAGIGVEPATRWLEGSGVEIDEGVLVNARFETSVPGVYAVGDVARFFDPIFGYARRIEHWSNANYQGTQLGKLLAGEQAPYDTVSSFFTELFGTTYRVYGDLRGDTELEGSFDDGRAIVRFREGGRLFGALTVGLEDAEQDALKEEIRNAA